MIELINIVLLGLLVITALAAIRLHDLFAVTIMFGIYSLLAAAVFVVLDAVDVAFTEAAVGVGISTILMLATIGLVGRQEKPPSHRPLLPLVVVIVTGAALVMARLTCRLLPPRMHLYNNMLHPAILNNLPTRLEYPMW